MRLNIQWVGYSIQQPFIGTLVNGDLFNDDQIIVEDFQGVRRTFDKVNGQWKDFVGNNMIVTILDK